MSFTVIIPARMKSTRLPEKPLKDICGKPMIVRVAAVPALHALPLLPIMKPFMKPAERPALNAS